MTGGIGTGKTTFVGQARDALRNAGVEIVTSPTRLSDSTATALVVDDAHQLTGAELQRLRELVDEPGSTMVIATEPRAHDRNLRALAAAIEQQRPGIRLGPLSHSEMSRLLGEPDEIRDVVNATAGIPFLVSAALTVTGPRSAPEISRAAFFALIDRLRLLDEPGLDALLITSLGTDLGSADLAAVLEVPIEEADALVDRARSTGLIDPSYPPQFADSVHRAVGHTVGAARHHELETALLRSQLGMGTLSTGLALRLAEHGRRDDRLAERLRQRVDAARGAPALTARMCRAAVAAGATDLRGRLADALALAGDCAAAAAEADELLGSPELSERAIAVRVAATVAAHDGNLDQAAELFKWLGPNPDACVGASAAIVLAGTGDLTTARSALIAADAGPPTASARAARNLASGLLLTIETGYSAAATQLGQALTAECSATQVMPDSPAAVVALAALHGGDPMRARSVLTRAIRQGDDPLFHSRHQLLLAWVKMQDGQLAAATADASGHSLGELHRRDALWAAALRTAIARRAGDLGGVQKHWHSAVDILAEYSVDLFSLLPLGELWISAARVGQTQRLAPFVERAFGLLQSLGNPAAWAVPLHWAGVHAGILANDPAAVAPHGQALTAASAHSPFASALAGAGRAWLRVLANQVESAEVDSAARALAQFGLTSDATRLAGQAALQATDTKVSGAMLQVARDLKLIAPDEPVDIVPGSTSGKATGRPEPASPSRPSSSLSEREREVAELLLLGMPYRDIGAQLFISAKTVEHHVARIRRRLGAESRPAMLSMLRSILAPEHSDTGGQ